MEFIRIRQHVSYWGWIWHLPSRPWHCQQWISLTLLAGWGIQNASKVCWLLSEGQSGGDWFQQCSCSDATRSLVTYCKKLYAEYVIDLYWVELTEPAELINYRYDVCECPETIASTVIPGTLYYHLDYGFHMAFVMKSTAAPEPGMSTNTSPDPADDALSCSCCVLGAGW